MANKLYHKDLGFPSKLRFPTGKIVLEYTRHALEEAQKDRYGSFNLPRSIEMSECEVIEAELVDGALNKILVRKPYDEERDICIVVMHRTGKVKTVWVNVRGDCHKTLDKSKYKEIKR